MIKADKANAAPSERVLKRAARMRAEILQHIKDFETITDVRVEPDEPGKAVRIVRFIHEDEEGKELKILCFDEKTLVACDANRYGLLCSHCLVAINMLTDKWNKTREAED